MPSRSTLVSEIQQLLTGERADPRAAQAVFLLPVVMELLLRVLIGGRVRRLLHLRPPDRRGRHRSARCSSALRPAEPSLDDLAAGARHRRPGHLPPLRADRDRRRRGVPGDLARPAVRPPGRHHHHGRRCSATFVLPTLFQLGLTLMDAISRVSQMTLMAVICSAAVGLHRRALEGAGRAGPQHHRASRAGHGRRHRAAPADPHDRQQRRRRAGRARRRGAYDSMNPRHEDFMRWPTPRVTRHGRSDRLRLRRRRRHPARPRGHADHHGRCAARRSATT